MPPQQPQISDALRQAIQRRSAGEAPSTAPVQQGTPATGTLPTGGANTPLQPAPGGTPDARSVGVPTGQATTGQKATAAGQIAQSPQFDDDTRKLGKALVKKLLDVL